jgi:hypothetical protein
MAQALFSKMFFGMTAQQGLQALQLTICHLLAQLLKTATAGTAT